MRACSAPFATASSPCATIRPVQPRTCRRCSLDGSRYVIVRRSCWSIHQGLPSDEPKSTTFDRSGGSPARRYFTLPKVVAPHSFMRLSSSREVSAIHLVYLVRIRVDVERRNCTGGVFPQGLPQLLASRSARGSSHVGVSEVARLVDESTEILGRHGYPRSVRIAGMSRPVLRGAV
jgi:hypothetical protein